MISELVNGFTALPPGIQVWALKQVGTWAAVAAEKLGVAAWQKGKTTLLGDALHRAFQAGLTKFLDGFPARDNADYDILRWPFEDDAIISEESAKLLRLEDDPVDLDRIESSLRAAGLAPETLPDFDLGQALQRFFLAFLNAANDEEELRAKFQTALQYRTAQDSPIRFKHDRAAVARYNQHVVDRYGRLTLYSLKADAPLRVELERVYVQLTAVEQVRRREPTPREKALGDFIEKILEDEEDAERGILSIGGVPLVLDGSVGVERGALSIGGVPLVLDGSVGVEREITVTRTLSAREALAESARLVIVGAPGSGKTTLLQWIALTFARDAAQKRLGLAEQRVPVFVPLRALGKHIGNHPDRFEPTPACLLDFLAGYFGGWQLNLPAEFFVRLADEGRCAFLFDGLDEVADPGRRADVTRAVQAFVARYPGNRYAVTSRPAGYTGLAHFGADFQRCDVRAFSDDDVRDFVTNWYLAVETTGEDNPATRLKADENAADLLQRIRENDRIRRLVDTPLLLTVVALVHQNRTTLPHRRAELYDECTQMLLGFWDEQKGGEAARELAQLGELDRYEKRAILEPIALRLHEQREAREVEGPDLRRWLAEEFAAVGDPDPGKRAKLFLQVIQERAGLLVESDADTYRFSHLTFQEYLAARAVADRDDYVDYTLHRRHDPWWREVVLLETGHLSTPRSKRARRLTTKLVEAIWQEEDEDPLEREIERLLRRNLLLAGHCLADLGPIGVEDAVRDSIVAELSETLRTSPYSKLREEAARVLAGLGGGGSVARAAAELIATLTTGDWRIRQVAARSLGQLGYADAEVVRMLISTIIRDHPLVRWTAAFSLGQLEQADPTVIASLIYALPYDLPFVHTEVDSLCQLAQASPEGMMMLLHTLADNDNWITREIIAYSLSQLKQVSPEVMEVLIQVLTDADSWRVRQVIASSLGQLGQNRPKVVEALLNALSSDDFVVRWAAASSLGQLRQTNSKVIEALFRTFADTARPVRWAAASSLGQLGQVAPNVVQTLVHDLTDADNWHIRETVALSLGQLGQTSPEIIEALIHALTDSTWPVRQAAASSLGQLGQINPKVTIALNTTLADDDHNVRQAAALSLVRLRQANSQVVEVLLHTLVNADWYARRAAASSLGQLGQTSPEVVQTLLTTFTNDDSWRVRQAVASSLGQLAAAGVGYSSPNVVQTLIAALADDDSSVRQAAASSLGQLGAVGTDRTSADIIQALIAALTDANWRIRQSAAFSLGQLVAAKTGRPSLEVVQTLIAALADDDNWHVRQAAASSLGQLIAAGVGRPSPNVVQTLIAALTDDDSSVRQAAASSLGQFDGDDPEAVVKTLLPIFTDPAFEKPAKYSDRPTRDYAFDVLWAIAGPGTQQTQEAG